MGYQAWDEEGTATMRHNQNLSAGSNRRRGLKRLLFSGLAAPLALVLSVSGCRKNIPDVNLANVILISIDTLRADHLGCYGYERPTSPAIDRIASEGVLFKNASATSPWTLPSHGSMLTGFYPSRLGLTTNRSALPSDVKTLAAVLSERGFTTAAFVNSLLVSQEFGFAKGFKTFKRLAKGKQPQGIAPRIINLAKRWLQEIQGRNFFLFLHFYDVHSDYVSQPHYKRQFAGSYSGAVDGTTEQLLAFRKGDLSLDDKDKKHLIDLYDAGVRQLDDRLQGFFDFLQQQDLLEKSILIVTSDHGEEFLDHGGVLHGRTQYQELIHVPLILRGPNIPQARRIKDIVSLVDIMPTVLGILEISIPSGIEGWDLSPLWQETSTQIPSRLIFAEADHNNEENDIKRAIRNSRYKLHYDLLSKERALYDLESDPHERIDIAPREAPTIEKLLQALEKFMKGSRKSDRTATLSAENIEKLKRLGYVQ